MSLNGKCWISVSTLLRLTWLPYTGTLAEPKQIRIIRRQLGMSRTDLAQELEVSPSTVRAWESREDNKRHRPIPTDKYLQLKQLHRKLFE